MKKLRIILLPFAAIAELLMFVFAWLCVFVGNTNAANKVVNKAKDLPQMTWYFGKDE